MKKLVAEPFLASYKQVKHLIKLKERYFDIFEFRNGLKDGTHHTLEETGERFGGISGNRVRQLEARVIFEIGQAVGMPTPFD